MREAEDCEAGQCSEERGAEAAEGGEGRTHRECGAKFGSVGFGHLNPRAVSRGLGHTVFRCLVLDLPPDLGDRRL